MRKRFEQQNTLDATPVHEVKIDGKSRDELPKLLAALQYIFVTPELNKEVFAILEERVCTGKKKTGRLGMSLWEILVLGTVRLCMDIDYDRLRDEANHHSALRGILGVHTRAVFGEGKIYPIQTVKDNVVLLDEETLDKISALVVKAGHQLKKKEEEEEKNTEPKGMMKLRLSSDTYVAEANVHFPTDLWLLWCSCRKSLDALDDIMLEFDDIMSGWRKINHWYKLVKRAYRRSSNIHRKKGKNYVPRLKSSVKDYLKTCRTLLSKVNDSELILSELSKDDPILKALLEQLQNYRGMLEKHVDLVERRILNDEMIPHAEKVFSIFEQHVEWISKGKQHKRVELGHNVLVTRDQWGFIIDHLTVFGEQDTALVIPLADRLHKRFGKQHGYVIQSHSFDRGFHSKLNEDYLKKFVEQVILPKPGYKSAKRESEESDDAFVKLCNKHSAVESTINELEHCGVNKVPDKGEEGFKRYVAYGVLAFNLKRLGALVIEQELLDTIVDTRTRKMPPWKKRKRAA